MSPRIPGQEPAYGPLSKGTAGTVLGAPSAVHGAERAERSKITLTAFAVAGMTVDTS